MRMRALRRCDNLRAALRFIRSAMEQIKRFYHCYALELNTRYIHWNRLRKAFNPER